MATRRPADVEACIQSLSKIVEPGSLDEIFHRFDQNRDGYLQYNEFVTCMTTLQAEHAGSEEVNPPPPQGHRGLHPGRRLGSRF